MRPGASVLLIGLLAVCQGQVMFSNDWMRGLFSSIERLNQDLQGNIQRMNEQIQANLRTQLARVDQLTQDAVRTAENGSSNQYTVVNPGGQSIVVNSGQSAVRTVISGHTKDGQPYFRDSEDKIIGDTLHHTDKSYNAAGDLVNEHKYTLDLKKPDARPEPVKAV
ncbi:uncharacterized protein LOC105704282 isoform X2 [Orussus abietinus]|uniref:uncharacterized protein LOC105704282 isoform X2 n=1 Tax=Orussus abietinus TaxID=222816 RepID=UPI000626B2BF|nr:uncharacterized protein LOC105704282 isoform X2 [Orussus abietinus]